MRWSFSKSTKTPTRSKLGACTATQLAVRCSKSGSRFKNQQLVYNQMEVLLKYLEFSVDLFRIQCRLAGKLSRECGKAAPYDPTTNQGVIVCDFHVYESGEACYSARQQES